MKAGSQQIKLYLCPSVPEEKALLDQYNAMPRIRRAEWLRSICIAAFTAGVAPAQSAASRPGVVAAPARPLAPPRAVDADASATVTSISARQETKPANDAPARRASDMKGFFKENTGGAK